MMTDEETVTRTALGSWRCRAQRPNGRTGPTDGLVAALAQSRSELGVRLMSQADHRSVAHCLAPPLAAHHAAYDANDAFVAENYVDLKQHKIFSAACAQAGWWEGVACRIVRALRELAHACGLNGFGTVMHATCWRDDGVALAPGPACRAALKRIAAAETVLISSGGSAWLESSGKAEKVRWLSRDRAEGYRAAARWERF